MFTPFWYLYFCLWTSRGFFFFFFLIKERSCTNKVLIFISESKFEAHFFSWLCMCLKLKLTCLFAKTSSTASLSSSSASILDSSSLASFTLSLSLLSTTKMSPAYKKQKQQKNTALKKKKMQKRVFIYILVTIHALLSQIKSSDSVPVIIQSGPALLAIY